MLTKIKNLISAVAGFFSEIIEKIAGGKRRPVLIYAGGGRVILALLFIAFLAMPRNKPGAEARTGTSASAAHPALSASPPQAVIPPEELFLPEEPDFVPGVQLGRERRTIWTAEDAAPFWQDLLENGEEPWRKQVEAIADELLEGVP
jgi:hypothetical protein